MSVYVFLVRYQENSFTMASDASALFESVIDAITNDRFMQFIEQYTHSLVSPLSPKYLSWCDTAPQRGAHENEDDDDAALLTSSPSTSLTHYSMKHFEVFQAYQAMFESRIQSVLRKVENGKMSPDSFFELCAKTVAKTRILEDELKATHLEGGKEDSNTLTDVHLCQALLEMVGNVSDFQHFAGMMASRQIALLTDDGSSDDDEVH